MSLGVIGGCDTTATIGDEIKQDAEAELNDDTLVAMGGPLADDDDDDDDDGCDDDDDAPNGKKLFNKETFQGNGRTCRTCHTKSTGALSPAQVQAAYAEDPTGPLFRSIDSDDGVGNDYSRLLAHATVRVTIPLPPGWTLVDDPQATEVTLLRGVPTTMNVPSLDDIFMYDARYDSLEAQALGAIDAHAEPGRPPTPQELEAIADFQQTKKFFNNKKLKKWALKGGPPPQLPPGETESEIRGREFFLPGPNGLCAFCHDGPMLNETSGFLPEPPLPAGVRVFTAFVSELNPGNLPVHTFEVDNGDGTTTIVQTPDPGRALITGDLADLNLFRTPTLWGVEHTAPYFHDNSAATLEEMMDHYSDYFVIAGFPAFTEQEKTDIINYLKLL
ncbi:MAG: cytochrome c peroxidase [Myxococcota bacterium]